MVAPRAAHAAPRQIVVMVVDGLSPQVMEFGAGYMKHGDDADNTPAFEEFKNLANAQPADGMTPDALKGILKTAAANGYKTGLVTTDDVTQDAALFYDLPQGDAAATARSLVSDVKFDFLAGGGRGAFVPQGTPGSRRADALDLGKELENAGGTAILTAEALEDDEDIKGKTLVLQSDAALSYALDRDAETEGGLSDLAALSLQTLAADNAPFFLVIHDTLLAKALAAKDTPALAGQFSEIDTVLANVLGVREDSEKPADFGIALLTTGATSAPRFTTTSATERSNTFFILSELPVSFAKAGATLQGTDADKLTDFATEEYKGWKLTPETRTAILGGTIMPEAAIRASYEPVLQLSYDPITAQPLAFTSGLEAGGVLQALQQAAATKPAAK
jgi:alkaline phosphatase